MKIAAVAVILLAATPAAADHSVDQHVTDEMPYTLRPGEVRLGLWKVEAGFELPGPVGPAQIGTYTWPYLLWLADLKQANGYAKMTVLSAGRWSGTVGGGLVHARFTDGDDTARFTVVPVEGMVGYRFGKRITLAGGAVYTHVSVDGVYEPDEDDFFLRGGVALSNLQVPLTMEWRWSRVTALLLQGRFLAFQDTGGRGYTETQLDEATRVTVVATGETDALEPLQSFAVTADFVWSWRHVNLRAGLSYGNISLPMLNFVLPAKIPFPNLDLFVRF